MLGLFLFAVFAGTFVYCVLTIVAAKSYRAVRPMELLAPVPISVLKPLSGLEPELESNLRTFFQQKYPEFEILFAVRSADDPAAGVVEKLRAEHPDVPARLIVTGEPPYPNAKVFSLDCMKAEARHELLLMSDSDIRATPEMLSTIAAEFQDPIIGIVTCPYRAVPAPGIWSQLEAVGMNTQFFGGVLVARMLEGMKFAIGPTIAARKTVLEEIGGFDRLKDYLAEDFVMGKLAVEHGYKVLLSSYVIEHHIGGGDFRENWTHRLRWARSTRRSRPKGYIGEFFTMPVPVTLLIVAIKPTMAVLLVLAVWFRFLAAASVVEAVRLPVIGRWSLLFLPQDLLAFGIWIAGFFGDTIVWRGRRYRLLADGRFTITE